MPGKAKDKPEASSSRGAKVKPTMTKCSSTSPHKTDTTADSPTRQTPYERLRQLLAEKTTKTRRVTTVEELQTNLRNTAEPPQKLTMKMKLLWASNHMYQNFKLARLHLIDAASPEPLEDLLKLFRDSYDENRDEVDSVLLTATMWDTDSALNELPPAGKVIEINGYSSLKLFQEKCCQVTVKLRDLSWDPHA